MATKNEFVGTSFISLSLALTNRVGPAAMENPKQDKRLVAKTLADNRDDEDFSRDAMTVKNAMPSHSTPYNSQSRRDWGTDDFP